MFRELNEQEQKEFKQWAHDNYAAHTKIEKIWHPMIQKECSKINAKHPRPESLKMTKFYYMILRGQYRGICMHCGAEKGRCEPDARYYPCDECENKSVFGIEELVIMDELQIIENRTVLELNEYIEKFSEIKPKLDEIGEQIRIEEVHIINDNCDEWLLGKCIGYLENFDITVTWRNKNETP